MSSSTLASVSNSFYASLFVTAVEEVEFISEEIQWKLDSSETTRRKELPPLSGWDGSSGLSEELRQAGGAQSGAPSLLGPLTSDWGRERDEFM